MKVRYKGETDVSLTANKIYEVLSIEDGLYRIVDDTEEDYLYPPEQFEIKIPKNEYNVNEISKYARECYKIEQYDEVFTEYRVKKILGG